jgi:hypothetical protein
LLQQLASPLTVDESLLLADQTTSVFVMVQVVCRKPCHLADSSLQSQVFLANGEGEKALLRQLGKRQACGCPNWL